MSGASVDRPRIVVLNDWEQALRRLGDWGAIDAQADVEVLHVPLQGEALVAAIKDADALVLVRDRTPVDEALLERLPRLRYLVFTGTRNTTLDLEALHRRGIAVSHTEWGPSKDSTCEMTWTLILAAVKQLELYTRSLREGRWRAGKPAPLPGVLAGRRLGLVGLGEIGSRVAQIGKAFGMDVVTWSPRMTEERAAEKGVRFMPLDELLSTSDVVSLHLVPTAETRHLLDARHLSLMQPHSVLVNTSRAALGRHGRIAPCPGDGAAGHGGDRCVRRRAAGARRAAAPAAARAADATHGLCLRAGVRAVRARCGRVSRSLAGRPAAGAAGACGETLLRPVGTRRRAFRRRHVKRGRRTCS